MLIDVDSSEDEDVGDDNSVVDGDVDEAEDSVDDEDGEDVVDGDDNVATAVGTDEDDDCDDVSGIADFVAPDLRDGPPRTGI